MTRRARKVLPVAGRGEATMNTAVHGCVCGSAVSETSLPIAASTDWLWLSATFTVSVQGLQPCNIPAARSAADALTVTYACYARLPEPTPLAIIVRKSIPPAAQVRGGTLGIML